MRENKIFYTAPAADWNEALPLGNGRLGMMVFGGVTEELIQLNEETLWSGFPCPEYDNPETKEKLPEIRRLLFEGRIAEAQALCERYFVCRGKGHQDADGGFGSYQTAGELTLHLPERPTDGYRRALLLDEGRAEVSYGDITREYFISPTYEVAVVRVSGVGDDFSFTYARENAAIFADEDEILAVGRLPLAWAFRLRHVREGDDHLLYLTVATDYQTDGDPAEVCRHRLDRAIREGHETLRKDTAAYFGELLGRAVISLPGDPALRDLPTNERLAAHSEDPGFAELYFNFGRYLLVSSARGVLPPNLQGIWCRDYKAPWSADYHININIQMNHWPAEVTGLSELLDPFFSYIEMLAEAGKNTARVTYGCPGWVAHHQTNPWGYTSLGRRPLYGAFPAAGAWCLRHVWERWLYSQDPAILRRFYPTVRDAVDFFLAYLVTDPRTGYLVTGPVSSPENSYIDPTSGEKVNIAAGTAMDSSILRELFTLYLETVRVLEIEDGDRPTRVREARERLMPLAIGKTGALVEWNEDFAEAEPGHRHISHLYALYPAAEVTSSTPELFAAARRTIERRLANGGGHTGWSRAWIINFFARLRDGEAAHENLLALFEKSTLKNLFDNHPPFQIDGNFGGAAGIAEMLLASHDGGIELLPALPAAWANGAFRHLRARGGFVVSAAWRDGRVIACEVRGREGAHGRITYNREPHDFVGDYRFGEMPECK